MKIDDIAAFVAVIRRQSLSQAAASLGLTQSAVTRRMQNLEEALGVELLDRHTKPLKPTTMGMRVYEQCRRILLEVDALRDLVANDAPPSGVLRVGVPHSLSEVLLLPPLRRLGEHYANLQTRVSSGWGTELIARVENADLDAALAMFPSSKVFPETIQAEPLGQIRLLVVASHHADIPTIEQLADSHHHGWILNPDGCGFRAGLKRALADRGLNLQVNLETFGSELQLGLVAEGKGLGLVPEPVLARSHYRDALRVLPLSDFQPEAELWLVYPRFPGKLLQPARLFAATLAGGLGLEVALSA